MGLELLLKRMNSHSHSLTPHNIRVYTFILAYVACLFCIIFVSYNDYVARFRVECDLQLSNEWLRHNLNFDCSILQLIQYYMPLSADNSAISCTIHANLWLLKSLSRTCIFSFFVIKLTCLF